PPAGAAQAHDALANGFTSAEDANASVVGGNDSLDGVVLHRDILDVDAMQCAVLQARRTKIVRAARNGDHARVRAKGYTCSLKGAAMNPVQRNAFEKE